MVDIIKGVGIGLLVLSVVYALLRSWQREAKKEGERTIAYCTKPGIRDKFSDHTCLVGDLEWPKPRANEGFFDV